jgi:hypothetical protein
MDKQRQDGRKPVFVEPELIKYQEKLADITTGTVGYIPPDDIK